MTTTSTGTAKQVVVKFARTYNSQAHHICAEAGCAPELYYVGQVNNFHIIFMEYIEKAVYWEKASTNIHTVRFCDNFLSNFRDNLLENKKTAMEVIQTAIGRLHANGLVHGDLRSANILISGKWCAS